MLLMGNNASKIKFMEIRFAIAVSGITVWDHREGSKDYLQSWLCSLQDLEDAAAVTSSYAHGAILKMSGSELSPSQEILPQ